MELTSFLGEINHIQDITGSKDRSVYRVRKEVTETET